MILPNAKIGLLVDLGKRADRFLIVDSLGTIKYTKKLSQKCISQEFKASAQHIIYLFKNNLKQDRSFIEIYDFKLKLLNSFNFNEYFSNIITYDHFFFISSIHKKKILVYDIERQQITRLNFNCDIKLGLAEPLLFHFDGSYYYITNNVDCVYLIDCKTLEIHKTIATTGGMLFSIFSADYHGNIIQYDRARMSIDVYNSNGSIVFNTAVKEMVDKYSSLDFSICGKIVCNKSDFRNIIQYDVY